MEPDSGEERCITYQEHAHWKHKQGNTFLACAAPSIYREDKSSQHEHAWSVWLLSLCKPGLTSSLNCSPWFCGATTQSQKVKPLHIRSLSLFYALMRATSYTHLRKKSCSATCGEETRRYSMRALLITRLLCSAWCPFARKPLLSRTLITQVYLPCLECCWVQAAKSSTVLNPSSAWFWYEPLPPPPTPSPHPLPIPLPPSSHLLSRTRGSIK